MRPPYTKGEYAGGGTSLDIKLWSPLRSDGIVMELVKMRYWPVTFALYSLDLHECSSKFNLSTLGSTDAFLSSLPVIN